MEKDYFEYYDELSKEVQDILSSFSDRDDTYQTCVELEQALLPYGYTFEWGLDATPYGLRKITDEELYAMHSKLVDEKFEGKDNEEKINVIKKLLNKREAPFYKNGIEYLEALREKLSDE